MKHYSLASIQNHSLAQTALGKIYFDGKYVAQFLDIAIYYINLAANKNEPSALL